jgi:hypothetical protein
VSKRPGRVQRFLRWLFGSPFQDMSDAFGDPMPPELRVFEAQVVEMQDHSHGKVAAPTIHSDRTRRA